MNTTLAWLLSQTCIFAVCSVCHCWEQGQRCQIHFVVACGDDYEQSVMTWLAVDRASAEILKGADCA